MRAPDVSQDAAAPVRIGFHVSIEGGLPHTVDRAVERGCTAFQVFCGNPRGWALQKRSPEEIQRFREARTQAGLSPLCVHACYLINPCSQDDGVLRRSIQRLRAELELSAAMGADLYVLHPGSHKGRPASWGLARAEGALGRALGEAEAHPPLLLEGTASPHGPGGDLQTLGALVHSLDDVGSGACIGVALDSCHLFGAGYDLRRAAEVARLVGDLKRHVGLGKVGLLHVNDSRDRPGSRRDRHEHIGRGTIGTGGLRHFLNHRAFEGLPMILETPWESLEDDRRNLCAVLDLL